MVHLHFPTIPIHDDRLHQCTAIAACRDGSTPQAAIDACQAYHEAPILLQSFLGLRDQMIHHGLHAAGVVIDAQLVIDAGVADEHLLDGLDVLARAQLVDSVIDSRLQPPAGVATRTGCQPIVQGPLQTPACFLMAWITPQVYRLVRIRFEIK